MIRSSKPSIPMVRNTTGTRTSLIAMLIVAVALIAVTLGMGSAKALSFGSDLDPSVQPSNVGTAHECNGR